MPSSGRQRGWPLNLPLDRCDQRRLETADHGVGWLRGCGALRGCGGGGGGGAGIAPPVTEDGGGVSFTTRHLFVRHATRGPFHGWTVLIPHFTKILHVSRGFVVACTGGCMVCKWRKEHHVAHLPRNLERIGDVRRARTLRIVVPMAKALQNSADTLQPREQPRGVRHVLRGGALQRLGLAGEQTRTLRRRSRATTRRRICERWRRRRRRGF